MQIDGFDSSFLGDSKNNKKNNGNQMAGSLMCGVPEDGLFGDLISAMFGGFGLPEDALSMKISYSPKQPNQNNQVDSEEKLAEILHNCDTKTLKKISRATTEELKRRGLI